MASKELNVKSFVVLLDAENATKARHVKTVRCPRLAAVQECADSTGGYTLPSHWLRLSSFGFS